MVKRKVIHADRTRSGHKKMIKRTQQANKHSSHSSRRDSMLAIKK